MDQIILHHHLGLGDHFVCCGLVNNISQQYEKLYLPCKKRNFETVKCLYSENKKVHLLKILNDEHREVYDYSKQLDLSVLKVGFNHPQFPMNPTDWYTAFYKQLSIDFTHRYSSFNLPKNIKNLEKVYQNVVGDIKEYILVHDSSSETDQYDIDLFDWRDGDNSHLPVIKISDKVTDNLLEWMKVIENATEIHTVPSSVFFLIDSVFSNLKANLFYHRIRPGYGNTMIVNSDLNNYKWNIVEY